MLEKVLSVFSNCTLSLFRPASEVLGTALEENYRGHTIFRRGPFKSPYPLE